MPTDEKAEKARALRLQRLKSMLEKRLENPAAALELLITELELGERQTKLWEDLHAAAARDRLEEAMGTAYIKGAGGRRLQKLSIEAQVDVLMHAADFYQGILGDIGTAENFLARVHHVSPGHPEAFARLEKRFETLPDSRLLLELYAAVAPTQPRSKVLSTKVLTKIVLLPATAPLADEACERLVAFAATNPKLLEAVEAHCRKTKRPALAASVLEKAVDDPALEEEFSLKIRRRIVELYVGEANAPAKAIAHVEALLNDDPHDEVARRVAEKLLSSPAVSKRAANLLQKVRRWVRDADRRKI